MKKLIFAAMLIMFSIPVISIEVDIDEISKSKKVNFINYSGRGGKFESTSEIKSIGHRLSYLVRKSDTEKPVRFNAKYSIVRAIDKNDRNKLSADIIFIDKTAKVDHIRNVRRIISSYLEGMYGYTVKEADAVAVYTTYYNAIYRGNLDYFSSKYNAKVNRYLTKRNAGISTLYSDWPGNTAIVIPLTEQNKRGEIGGIDPFVISDEKVKKEVRKDNGNKTSTEEIITLKEKDIEKGKEDVKVEKEKLEEKKKESDEKKKNIEEKKIETEKKKEEIKKEKQETAKITDPEKRKVKEGEIKKKEEVVKKEEKKITEDEKKIKSEDEKIKKEEKEIVKKEEEIKKKEDEVKKEKTETGETDKEKTPEGAKENNKTGDGKNDNGTKKDVKDEKTVEKEETLKKKEESLKEKEKELDKREDSLKDKKPGEGVFGLKIYYLEVKEYLEDGHYNNSMYMINTTTRKIEFKSPVDNICGRRYDVYSGGIAVITHAGGHKVGHHLTLLDRETLKATKSGEENIFWRSFIEIRENHIYAIIKDGENYYLGKFDSNLKLVAKSSEKIYLNTFITFFEKYIYINKEDRSIMVLNADDLKLTDVIKP